MKIPKFDMRHAVWLFLWCVTCLAPAPAAGQAAAVAASTASSAARVTWVSAGSEAAPMMGRSESSAELRFFNRLVFEFRGTLSGIGPDDRAKRAQTRISHLLKQPGPFAVALKSDGNAMMVQINGATGFLVTPQDLDHDRDETLASASHAAAQALRTAIGEHQEAHSLDHWVKAFASAFAATFLALALTWLAGQAQRALARKIIETSTAHVQRLAVAGIPLLRRARAATVIQTLVTSVHRVLVLLICVQWTSFTLSQFPYTRPWGESINFWVLDLGKSGLTFFARTAPDLLVASIILYCTYALTQALRRLFSLVQEGSLRLDWLDADLAAPTRQILTVVCWLFGLAMAYPYLPGSQTEAFKGLSVLVGLMVTLGASGLVGQAISGLILTYGKIYRKGEYVRFGEHEGTVTAVGAFTTRLITGSGEEITISNSSILTSTTKNFSRAGSATGLLLDTTVTIGYDTPWRQVHAMLIEAAQRTQGVLGEPQAKVFQTALSDWYPQYRLVCHAQPAAGRNRAGMLSELHAHIQDVFNEYGVQIMSPQYVADPAAPKVVDEANWHLEPAGLARAERKSTRSMPPAPD